MPVAYSFTEQLTNVQKAPRGTYNSADKLRATWQVFDSW